MKIILGKKFLFILFVLALAMIMSLSTTVLAASVTPTDISSLGPGNSGNASPGDAGYSSTTYFSLKVDPPANGTYNDSTNSVQWTIRDGKYLNFSNASPGIVAVIVKGGNGAYLYQYPTGATADIDLRAPNNNGGNIPDISHFYFIWGGPGYPTPELPAVALFALGLVGIGGFVIFRRYHAAAAAR